MSIYPTFLLLFAKWIGYLIPCMPTKVGIVSSEPEEFKVLVKGSEANMLVTFLPTYVTLY